MVTTSFLSTSTCKNTHGHSQLLMSISPLLGQTFPSMLCYRLICKGDNSYTSMSGNIYKCLTSHMATVSHTENNFLNLLSCLNIITSTVSKCSLPWSDASHPHYWHPVHIRTFISPDKMAIAEAKFDNTKVLSIVCQSSSP